MRRFSIVHFDTNNASDSITIMEHVQNLLFTAVVRSSSRFSVAFVPFSVCVN